MKSSSICNGLLSVELVQKQMFSVSPARCEGNPGIICGFIFLSQRASGTESRYFRCRYLEQAVEQFFDTPVIWNAMTFKWRHCNWRENDSYVFTVLWK